MNAVEENSIRKDILRRCTSSHICGECTDYIGVDWKDEFIDMEEEQVSLFDFPEVIL